MNEKELIRDKWIRNTPLLKLSDCVDGAMKEFAKQECISFIEWINNQNYVHVSGQFWMHSYKADKKTLDQLYDQYLIDTENK